jgi:hypothetical protein
LERSLSLILLNYSGRKMIRTPQTRSKMTKVIFAQS